MRFNGISVLSSNGVTKPIVASIITLYGTFRRVLSLRASENPARRNDAGGDWRAPEPEGCVAGGRQSVAVRMTDGIAVGSLVADVAEEETAAKSHYSSGCH